MRQTGRRRRHGVVGSGVASGVASAATASAVSGTSRCPFEASTGVSRAVTAVSVAVDFSKNRSISTGNGMTRVLFFSAATSTTVCSSRNCSALGGVGHDGSVLGQLRRCLELAVGGDYPGAAFPLGLGLPGHRAFHAVGQGDVLDLDPLDAQAPRSLGGGRR